jgi:hypothetical protein
MSTKLVTPDKWMKKDRLTSSKIYTDHDVSHSMKKSNVLTNRKNK